MLDRQMSIHFNQSRQNARTVLELRLSIVREREFPSVDIDPVPHNDRCAKLSTLRPDSACHTHKPGSHDEGTPRLRLHRALDGAPRCLLEKARYVKILVEKRHALLRSID